VKIIFAGTPDFAASSLQSLLNSPHTVIAVYTQPDRPAGRGRKLAPSPVKQLASAQHIPVYQPLSLRDPQEQEILRELNADLMVVAAYGLILPVAVLNTPRLGCINVHASLLPRWRGAAPIQRAILAGDTTTGITIMQMDEGLDTGNMLSKLSCPIHPEDTAEQLHDRLATLGAEALLSVLSAEIPAGEPQNPDHATYAAKLTKTEAEIDWSLSAIDIERRIRAFNPWPIAYTYLNKQPLRIWQACIIKTENISIPGTIIDANKSGIDVATSTDIIRLLSVQLPGGKKITASEFLNAHPAASLIGTILEI
jgi:methionyl-tRNA formyltransferase